MISGRVFDRFVEERVSQLMLNAKLLSGDFAFKQAYADGDRDTLFSAVTNLQRHRIGADVMMLVDAEDNLVIIDTLDPDAFDTAFLFPDLIETAEETGQPSSSIESIGKHLYRLVVVPLLAPEPVAWIALGFLINDRLATNLKQLTLTDVSFFIEQNGRSILASTLPQPVREALADSTTSFAPKSDGRFSWATKNERYVALAITLSDQITVVLLVVIIVELGFRFSLVWYDFHNESRSNTAKAAEQLAQDVRSIMLNSGGPVAARTVYPILQRNMADIGYAIAILPSELTRQAIEQVFDFIPKGIQPDWPQGNHQEFRVELQAEEFVSTATNWTVLR